MKKVMLVAIAAMCVTRLLCVSALGQEASSGALSDEDLKRLVTEWKDEKEEVQFKLYATAAPRPLNARSSSGQREIEKYKKSGEVPYRVTLALYEYKKGSRRPKLASGMAKIYMVDADKKVVLNTSVSLSKLCPS